MVDCMRSRQILALFVHGRRVRARLTMAEAAKRAGVSAGQVGRAESYRPIAPRAAERLAAFAGLTITEIEAAAARAPEFASGRAAA